MTFILSPSVSIAISYAPICLANYM